jgi:hypothetical protein
MPENSIGSLKDNKYKVLPKENFYDDLRDEAIMSIFNRIDGYSKKVKKHFSGPVATTMISTQEIR